GHEGGLSAFGSWLWGSTPPRTVHRALSTLLAKPRSPAPAKPPALFGEAETTLGRAAEHSAAKRPARCSDPARCTASAEHAAAIATQHATAIAPQHGAPLAPSTLQRSPLSTLQR